MEIEFRDFLFAFPIPFLFYSNVVEIVKYVEIFNLLGYESDGDCTGDKLVRVVVHVSWKYLTRQFTNDVMKCS